jgi:hypothetical protein
VAFEVGATRRIGLAMDTGVHAEGLGCRSVGISGITPFESTVTDFAHPVKWKRPPKAVDGQNRLLLWAWWVYKVQAVL